MAIKMDYYYNQIGSEFTPFLNMANVINGEEDFVGCFIMTVNDKYVINDYEKYPENKVYTNSDWITWLGIQFMQSLIAFKNNPNAYCYIHFLEYNGGKGLEIRLQCNKVCISNVKSGIEWYSFDKKKENLYYYWECEEVPLIEYEQEIQSYCKKIFEEYSQFGLPIKDSLYSEFYMCYKKIFGIVLR